MRRRRRHREMEVAGVEVVEPAIRAEIAADTFEISSFELTMTSRGSPDRKKTRLMQEGIALLTDIHCVAADHAAPRLGSTNTRTLNFQTKLFAAPTASMLTMLPRDSVAQILRF